MKSLNYEEIFSIIKKTKSGETEESSEGIAIFFEDLGDVYINDRIYTVAHISLTQEGLELFGPMGEKGFEFLDVVEMQII